MLGKAARFKPRLPLASCKAGVWSWLPLKAMALLPKLKMGQQLQMLQHARWV